MDTMITRMGERLATGSSRRGFLGTMGKVAIGAAALAAGQGLGQATGASAAVSPDLVSLACCGGSYYVGCPNIGCPNGTYQVRRQNACCLGSNHWQYWCDDCYDVNYPNNYICTYPEHVCNPPQACPC